MEDKISIRSDCIHVETCYYLENDGGSGCLPTCGSYYTEKQMLQRIIKNMKFNAHDKGGWLFDPEFLSKIRKVICNIGEWDGIDMEDVEQVLLALCEDEVYE